MAEAKEMKTVIRRVSLLQGWRYTRICTLAVSIIGMLILQMYTSQVGAIAVVVLYFFMPIIINAVIKTETYWTNDALPAMKQAFHYRDKEYVSQMLTFDFVIIILMIWVKFNRIQTEIAILDLYPSILLIGMVALFFGFYVYFRIKIPFLLKNNRL